MESIYLEKVGNGKVKLMFDDDVTIIIPEQDVEKVLREAARKAGWPLVILPTPALSFCGKAWFYGSHRDLKIMKKYILRTARALQ